MHALGIVHRDIKPANVILANDGETVMLSDFGLSIPAEEAAPETDEADEKLAAAAMRGRRNRPSGGKRMVRDQCRRSFIKLTYEA